MHRGGKGVKEGHVEAEIGEMGRKGNREDDRIAVFELIPL